MSSSSGSGTGNSARQTNSCDVSRANAVFIRVHDDADGVRLRTRFHHDWNTSPTTVLVEERGVTSAWILEQIVDMLVPLVVEEQCCRQEDLRGAQKWSTSRTRSGSRSAQQIIDVSAPFMSE